jgi:hypothetical protein
LIKRISIIEEEKKNSINNITDETLEYKKIILEDLNYYENYNYNKNYNEFQEKY